MCCTSFNKIWTDNTAQLIGANGKTSALNSIVSTRSLNVAVNPPSVNIGFNSCCLHLNYLPI